MHDLVLQFTHCILIHCGEKKAIPIRNECLQLGGDGREGMSNRILWYLTIYLLGRLLKVNPRPPRKACPIIEAVGDVHIAELEIASLNLVAPVECICACN